MTDKWNEIVRGISAGKIPDSVSAVELGEYLATQFAQALRDAERAGMERAQLIAFKRVQETAELARQTARAERFALATFFDARNVEAGAIFEAIRAAKETKE